MTTDKLRKHADLMGKFIINEAKKIEAEHECPECHKMVCVCESVNEDMNLHHKDEIIAILKDANQKIIAYGSKPLDKSENVAMDHIQLALTSLGGTLGEAGSPVNAGSQNEYPSFNLFLAHHLEELIEKGLKSSNKDTRNFQLHDAITHMVEALKILKH
jgi:hypothetical protein